MNINKKHILLLLKLIIIAAAFALIYYKANTDISINNIRSVNPLAIIIGCALLIFAQIISAYRMQYYYNSQNLSLNNKFSIGLYFTGMLYNTILPGGISGDGYKVYLIYKLSNFAKLTSIRLLLSDRASGLFILIIFTLILSLASNFADITPYYNILSVLCLVITIIAYFTGIKLFLKENKETAIGAIKYSFIIQLTNIAIIFAILWGLSFDFGDFKYTNSYIILFLLSAILSVLPISIGGIGIRELTFMYGAPLLSLNAELGISLAILYFLINITCSFIGFIYWHKLEKIY